MKLTHVVIWIIVAGAGQGYALEYENRGQCSFWTKAARDQNEWRNNVGGRYLPEFTITQLVSDEGFFDLNMSVNGFAVVDNHAEPSQDADVEFYRLAFRFATAQTETQIGLQKMNFGPAQLLRSLQWFDQVDPRDPQQFTDGVYALRFRYSALNNANLWLWGLYGNDEPKGRERFPSADSIPEWGGRFQYPLLSGEFAATLHTREVDASSLNIVNFREHRLAVDGRWEATIGMWFEMMAQQNESDRLPFSWTTLLTLGADYTFGIGNGLYVEAEHLLASQAEDLCGLEETAHTTAIMLSYPVGFFDTVSAIGTALWERHEHSLYVNWQKSHDTYSLNFSVFDYPEQEAGASAFSGYGGQIMIMVYH